MNFKIFRIFIFIGLLFAASNLYSQTYLISAGGTITTCTGTIYDSGGAGGDYGSSEDYTITICGDLVGATMTLEFTSFSLESPTYDNLSIYDGPNTSSPDIITSAGNTSLDGVTVEGSGDCLTLVWHTDGSVTYPGFSAIISCGFPCQDFTIDIASSAPALTPPTDSLWVDVCQGEEVVFTALGNYPNNNIDYAQSDATLNWHWMIISETGQTDIEGVGLNILNYTFPDPGGYHINLMAEDVNGCSMPITDPWRVRVSLNPTFTGSTITNS